MNNKMVYLFWILLCQAVGALAGFLSKDGISVYQAGVKPAISPPGAVFAAVWTVLYLLMGIGAARVTLTAPGISRSRGLNLMVVQLAVNFCWPLLFFNLRVYAFALVWLLILLALAVLMSVSFYRTDKKAGLLQIPYIAWLCFAAVLNNQVAMMK